MLKTLLCITIFVGLLSAFVYDTTHTIRDYHICYEGKRAVYISLFKPDPLFITDQSECKIIKITKERATQISYSIKKGK